MFKKLEIGEVQPPYMRLQFVDRSITKLEGKIEDVLVKVNKFLFPADFVILDYEADREVPIILGQLFLLTSTTRNKGFPDAKKDVDTKNVGNKDTLDAGQTSHENRIEENSILDATHNASGVALGKRVYPYSRCHKGDLPTLSCGVRSPLYKRFNSVLHRIENEREREKRETKIRRHPSPFYRRLPP
ncbi:uncharacterized protein E5676_scaffold220G00020 [Cucumis melo var. makuwa]|nr:uncharacterized protein E5676_scaffold220G00020 [Cucumis melo var. makuwa]